MSNVSLLLIDDDEPLIEVLRFWLGSTRPIRVARSLAEGLKEIAEKSPDHILLDLGLPDSRPSETIERIKELKAKAPNACVIVITGWPGHEHAARNAGADGFIAKGSAADEFAAGLKAAVKKP